MDKSHTGISHTQDREENFYFFLFAFRRVTTKTITPIVMPNANPTAATKFVPSHRSTWFPNQPKPNMTTQTASVRDNKSTASLMNDSLGIEFATPQAAMKNSDRKSRC